MKPSPVADPGIRAAICVLVAAVHLLVGLVYIQWFGPPATRGILSRSGASYLASFPGWETDDEVDSAGFNRAATSILNSGLPRSRNGTLIWRTAVYAYFVAACYAIGGISLWPVAVAQAIASGLCCWWLSQTAGRWQSAAGIVAALLYLLNVRVAMYVGYVVPLLPTLLWTALALFAAERQRPVLFTTSLMLGIYTSSTFFMVALAAAFWWWWQRRTITPPILIGAAVALKFLLTLTDVAGAAPEPNRNADRGGIFWLSNNPYYERFSLLSQWEWLGSHPESAWRPTAAEQQRHQSYLTRAGGDPKRAALLWIRENPEQYLKLCLIRLRTEFSPFTGQMSLRNRVISTLVWLLIFPAGFWGLWRHRNDAAARLVMMVTVAVFAFATLVTEEPYLRYRMPVDLALSVFAAVVYADFWRRWRRLNSSNTADIRSP